MFTLIIGNVNCNNHGLLHSIAGDFGYGGSIRLIDECTRKINLIVQNEDDRSEAEQMVGRYAMVGFSIEMKA
jgi:hypothetical protein